MPAAERRGLLITLEGGEGSGKSTLAGALTEFLRDRGLNVCLTQEPGGTDLGRAIHSILQKCGGLTPLAELLLFQADRVQHVAELVSPALAAGMLVICDRFTDSSLAYQGYGRGLDLELIRRLNDEATGGLKPDLTLLLDVPPEVGLSREGGQTDVTGRESLDFHERVRAAFLELARVEPERFVVIDGALPPGKVTERAILATQEKLSLPQ
jgi:dTMP kinase